MHKELKVEYAKYHLEGGEASFEEWFNCLLETAEDFDFDDFVNEDIIEMNNHFDRLCEEIEIKVKGNKQKDPNARIDATSLKNKYKRYVKDCKSKNKEPLTYGEWIEKNNRANDLKKELARSGIKIVGATATAVGTSVALSAARKINKETPNERRKSDNFSYQHRGKKGSTTVSIQRNYEN